MKFKSILFAAFMCLLLSACSANLRQNHGDDILDLLSNKPEYLTFVNSKKGQGQTVLVATYRVSGANAHLIEDFFNQKAKMSRVKFVCCGWESHHDGNIEITEEFDNKYKSRYRYNYISVSMYSDQTLINDRSRWNEIENFYVTVDVLNI